MTEPLDDEDLDMSYVTYSLLRPGPEQASLNFCRPSAVLSEVLHPVVPKHHGQHSHWALFQ